LARQVGEEGTTFIFSSWVCVADGAGSFHHHLATTTGPNGSASTPRPMIDDIVEDLVKIQLFDLIKTTTILTTRLNFSSRCHVGVPLLLRLLIST
jgi:hypothetical protein